MSAPFSDFRAISHRRPRALVDKLPRRLRNRHPLRAPHLLHREAERQVDQAEAVR